MWWQGNKNESRIAAINRRIEKLSAEADYGDPKDVRKRSKLVRRLIMERTKLYLEVERDGKKMG